MVPCKFIAIFEIQYKMRRNVGFCRQTVHGMQPNQNSRNKWQISLKKLSGISIGTFKKGREVI